MEQNSSSESDGCSTAEEINLFWFRLRAYK
jgi:hypothetical protein